MHFSKKFPDILNSYMKEIAETVCWFGASEGILKEQGR